MPSTLLLLALLLLSACSVAPPWERTITLASQAEAQRPSHSLGEQPLRQEFDLTTTGLSEIDLLLVVPRRAPEQPSRPVRWQLRDSRQLLLREGTIESAGLLHNSPLQLRFDPLPSSGRVMLELTAPPEAEIALWASETEGYPGGALYEAGEQSRGDLAFTLIAQDSPRLVARRLVAAATRWQRSALWLPLLLVTPGWLLVWFLHPGGRRPVVPMVAGLSLALAPLVYGWSSLVQLRLYEPLVHSLFQASGLLLALLLIRHPARVRAAWPSQERLPLALLGGLLLAAMASWLLAFQPYQAPPGVAAPQLAEQARELVREGFLREIRAPLPPATLAATLTQMSRQPFGDSLLLGGLLLGVSLLPALFALALEVGGSGWAALWLLPLAWLWPTPWNAMASGEVALLYSIVLLPVVVAAGTRALRVTERPMRTVLLAAIPLAALALVQGAAAGLAWVATLAVVALLRALPPDPEQPAPPLTDLVLRALLWLLLAALLWLPAWVRGAPLMPAIPPLLGGYGLLAVGTGLAITGGTLARRARPLVQGLGLLALFLSLALAWGRSVPIPARGHLLSGQEREVLEWIERSTPRTSRFLLLTEEGAGTVPLDGGGWIPAYAERTTSLELALPPELLAQANHIGGLAEPEVRRRLQEEFAITHLYLGTAAALVPEELLAVPWLRLVHQQGNSYVFEFVTVPPATPASPGETYLLPAP